MTSARTRLRVRRTVIYPLALLAATALTLTACSTGSGSSDTSKTAGPVVNIGTINQFDQGLNADGADDMYDGQELGLKYVEEHGGLYNNGKIVLTKGTESGQPALVATSVRKLLTDNVRLFIGPTLTADALAAGPLIDAAGGVFISPATTTSLTGTDRTIKSLFRFSTNDHMTSAGLALKVAEKYKDVDTIDYVAYDYLQGHEGVDVFKATLKAKGINPKVGHEQFVAATTTNYSSQIGVLAQTPKDGKKRLLVLLTWGAGYVNFLQQAAPLDFLSNYSAVLTTSMYYKSAVTLKGTAPQITNSYTNCYYSMWKNDIMTWFTKEMQKAHNRVPDDWSTDGFDSVLIYAAAINKAKSTDPAKVSKALSTLKVDTVNGTFTMNPDTHQVEREVAVCTTIGDPKAPEGVKLVDSAVYPFKQIQ